MTTPEPTPEHKAACVCHKCLDTLGYRRYTEAAREERERPLELADKPAASSSVDVELIRALLGAMAWERDDREARRAALWAASEPHANFLAFEAAEKKATDLAGRYVTDVTPLLAALERAQQEISELRAALERIEHDTFGRVCDQFEVCHHMSCAASYAAWAIASAALNGETPESVNERAIVAFRSGQAQRGRG